MFVNSNVSDGLLSPFQEKVSKEGIRLPPSFRKLQSPTLNALRGPPRSNSHQPITLSGAYNLSICLWVPGIQAPSLAFGFTGLIKFVPNYYLSICIWVSGKQRSNHACVYNLCIRVYQFWQWLSQRKSVKTF